MYLYNLADALRKIGAQDSHVFEVERQVRELKPALEGTAAVSAFVGDGQYPGDGGWMLQKLWDTREWLHSGDVKGMYSGKLTLCPHPACTVPKGRVDTGEIVRCT